MVKFLVLLKLLGKMDTIGDFLTNIRNASRAGKAVCEVAAFGMRERIAKILKDNGFIGGYDIREVRKGVRVLSVYLKYVRGRSVISEIVRCSRPGCRFYLKAIDIPSVCNNLGMAVLSTSRGVMSGGSAREMHVGGELLFKVW